MTIVFISFPPFSLIALVIQNNAGRGGHRTDITVAKCATQPLTFMTIAIQNPMELTRKRALLFQPSERDLVHPLYPKLVLLLCHVSRGTVSGE